MAEHDPARVECIVADHRPNVVTEEIGVIDGYLGERTWRTRIKCDGGDCGFYAEGPRYWDVVRVHNAHLVDVINTELAPAIREAALNEAVARLQVRWDEGAAAGDYNGGLSGAITIVRDMATQQRKEQADGR